MPAAASKAPWLLKGVTYYGKWKRSHEEIRAYRICSDWTSSCVQMSRSMTRGRLLARPPLFFSGRAELPATSEIRQFFVDLKLDETLELAGEDGRKFLRAMTNFEQPLPILASEAVPGSSKEVIRRLLALGLLFRVEDVVHRTRDALVPSQLAAARLAPLSTEEKDRISSRVLRSLYKAWNRQDG